jgi:4-aminobutyrate aminotransferase-like enzyme
VPIVWKRARGANVEDVDGNVYIDLTAGFGVAGGGHGASSVVRAIRRQSGALIHGLGDVHPNAPRLALARRLTELVPGADNKVIFCTSGAEAVELAMKTATLYTGKHGFLTFEGGFHGQTYGALSVTSRERFREPFAPQLNQHVARVPYAYCYRCPLGLEYPACEVACLDPVEQALASPPESVGPIAAVIVEPVQGREGTVTPPVEYLPRLKKICEKAGVLLIVDELLTGFGRTGRWFCVEHQELTPDILCVGKAMGGGLPIAACVARAEIMDAWRHQEHEAPHSSTFMGNPVASAAALAAIQEIDERDLPARARVLGDIFLKRCRELRSQHRLVGDVRGMGLMVGIELVRDGESREPAGAEAGQVVRQCLEAGVILLAGGPSGNVLSLTPPLTITRRQLGHALGVLDTSLATVEEGMGQA